LTSLLRNHGSEHRLDLGGDDDSLLSALLGSDTRRAGGRHAVCDQMAVRLEDVVCRRTDLGTARHRCVEALESAADLMATAVGWGG
jgi:hypothetical protein